MNTSTNADALVVVGQAAYANADINGTLSDSPGNTYASLTAHGSGGGVDPRTRLSYKYAPAISASHSVTSSGSIVAEALFALGFTGVQAGSDPLGTQNGTTSSSSAVSTLQVGSVTPGAIGDLIVCLLGLAAAAGGVVSIDSGFTIIDTLAYSSGVNLGGYIAVLIAPSTSPVNPTWSWPSATQASGAIASFKAAAAGMSPFVRPAIVMRQAVTRAAFY